MVGERSKFTVSELVKDGVLEKPLDGNHGGTHPKSNDYVSEGIPFVMASDMISGRVDTSNCKFISKEQADGLRKGFAKTGDVLLSHKATIGRTAIVEETTDDYVMLTPQVTYYRIKDRDRLNNKYLRYYFDSAPFQDLFNQWAGGGSTRAYLGITGQLKLPIVLPPLPEQKAIAHVLGSLDDKIELNRRMNETLEGMAQALFKSWFVDFDPVIDNAIAVGNPIPEPLAQRADTRRQAIASGTANRESAQDFPASFRFTEELGWIPEGWEVSTIGEQVSAVGGGTPSTKNESFWNGEHLFCTPKDLSGLSSIVLEQTERHLTDLGAEKVSSGILPEGTVIMSSRAPIGYLAITNKPVTVNQGIIALVKNENYNPLFLLCWLRTNMERIVERANGSTFLEISKKNFKPIPFLKPSASCIELFKTNAELVHQRISVCAKSCQTLAKLRDVLLPKLISGELRIPQAEKMVEEAVV
jgi:type I restriction enzyme, S subunit